MSLLSSTPMPAGSSADASALRRMPVLDALEQAVYECRPGEGMEMGMGMVHHSDKGPQYSSIRYSERLAEAGIEPSMGPRR